MSSRYAVLTGFAGPVLVDLLAINFADTENAPLTPEKKAILREKQEEVEKLAGDSLNKLRWEILEGRRVKPQSVVGLAVKGYEELLASLVEKQTVLHMRGDSQRLFVKETPAEILAMIPTEKETF